MGRRKKEPIRVLAHGIKILTENKGKRYVMCLVETHPLFPNSKPNAHGRIYVQRARVVMTAKLGRVLERNEHVHHGKLGPFVDTLKNLKLLGAVEHNRHHKEGTRQKPSSRKKISQGLIKAFASGRRKRLDLRGSKNPFFGRRHTAAAKVKMREAKRR